MYLLVADYLGFWCFLKHGNMTFKNGNLYNDPSGRESFPGNLYIRKVWIDIYTNVPIMFNYPKVGKILKALAKMEGDILVLFIR